MKKSYEAPLFHVVSFCTEAVMGISGNETPVIPFPGGGSSSGDLTPVIPIG